MYDLYHNNEDEYLSIEGYIESIKDNVIKKLSNPIDEKTKIHVNFSLFIEVEGEQNVREFAMHLPKMDIMNIDSFDRRKVFIKRFLEYFKIFE